MHFRLPLSVTPHPSTSWPNVEAWNAFPLRKFQQPVVPNEAYKSCVSWKTNRTVSFLAGAVVEQGFVGDLFSTEVEENDQTLLVQSNKGTIYESRLQDLNLSERTSNGSFISDTISDEEVFDAYLKEVFKEDKASS